MGASATAISACSTAKRTPLPRRTPATAAPPAWCPCCSQLFAGGKPAGDASKAGEIRGKNAVARSSLLRANSSFIPETAFRQRKNFFAAKVGWGGGAQAARFGRCLSLPGFAHCLHRKCCTAVRRRPPPPPPACAAHLLAATLSPARPPAANHSTPACPSACLRLPTPPLSPACRRRACFLKRLRRRTCRR